MGVRVSPSAPNQNIYLIKWIRPGDVAKWLTQWFAKPPFMGSNPIVASKILEWGNRHLYKIYADEKFNIKDKNELINKLPLSHKLYEEFTEKILNPIDHVLFEKINEYNFEPKVY